uniref:Kinesin-like protein n=1 Tax=Globisporangium ultimum (strain ATCC 200006 / CBS 805.95 / DAOM BR144) TaxID=431595 RepID=K3WQ88_GLOUD
MAWRANANRAAAGGANAAHATPNKSHSAAAAAAAAAKNKPTIQAIAQIEKNREERRRAMAVAKKERQVESMMNEKMGHPGDVDFQRMIRGFREQNCDKKQPHAPPGETKITICVRKRPVNTKEVKKRDYDAVTCLNPMAIVHDCKLKVDGITKYLDSNAFSFDHTFDETTPNEVVYSYTAQPLVKFVFQDRGRATVFAGVPLEVWVSFFEIYGGRCQDLLHRKRLTIREDGAGEVQIVDLEEVQPTTTEELLQIINKGNSLRTTHATEMNDVSSRSHCICQITVRERGSTQLYGKLSLIDLAGSERGQDTKNHNRQRRMESSEINKSLLALKECFRNTAIDDISADTTEHWTAVVVALIFRFAQAS